MPKIRHTGQGGAFDAYYVLTQSHPSLLNAVLTTALPTSLIPSASLTYDLGSAAFLWNNLYVGNIILPGFIPGSVLFIDAGGAIAEDNANLFWDDALNRLGIGTNVPAQQLHVVGNVQGNILISTVAIGTAPLTVTSTTLVTNLNADRVDNAHVGTSGATIPLLNTANFWSNTQQFTTNTQLQFRAAGQRIYSSAVNQLDIDATSEIEMTAPVVDINAATGLALDGANLNTNWTVNTTNRIYLRNTNAYLYSNAVNEVTLAASTRTIIGVAGDIVLGDGTLRDMYPQTDARINMGTLANEFNNAFFDGTVRTDALRIDEGGSTNISTGVGNVRMSSTNTDINDSWIPINYAGTVYYIPGWLSFSP